MARNKILQEDMGQLSDLVWVLLNRKDDGTDELILATDKKVRNAANNKFLAGLGADANTAELNINQFAMFRNWSLDPDNFPWPDNLVDRTDPDNLTLKADVVKAPLSAALTDGEEWNATGPGYWWAERIKQTRDNIVIYGKVPRGIAGPPGATGADGAAGAAGADGNSFEYINFINIGAFNNRAGTNKANINKGDILNIENDTNNDGTAGRYLVNQNLAPNTLWNQLAENSLELISGTPGRSIKLEQYTGFRDGATPFNTSAIGLFPGDIIVIAGNGDGNGRWLIEEGFTPNSIVDIDWTDDVLPKISSLRGPAGPRGNDGPEGPEGPEGPSGSSYSETVLFGDKTTNDETTGTTILGGVNTSGSWDTQNIYNTSIALSQNMSTFDDILIRVATEDGIYSTKINREVLQNTSNVNRALIRVSNETHAGGNIGVGNVPNTGETNATSTRLYFSKRGGVSARVVAIVGISY